MFYIIYLSVITVLISIAAVTDIRRGVIPDAISLSSLAAGIVRIIAEALSGDNYSVVVSGLAGAIAAALITIVPAMLGKLGGGDFKLLTASALGIGFFGTLSFLCISFLLSALYMITKNIVIRIRAGRAGMISAGGPGNNLTASSTSAPLAPFMIPGALFLLITESLTVFSRIV